MTFRALPALRGVYRVRVADHDQLAYIGQTGRSVATRLRELALPTCGEAMPFNDPHTAAPCLWAYRRADNLDFACSAAAVDFDDARRRGLEDHLLWQYRLEAGASTLANYGRFHPHYIRPSNRKQGRYMAERPSGADARYETAAVVNSGKERVHAQFR